MRYIDSLHVHIKYCGSEPSEFGKGLLAHVITLHGRSVAVRVFLGTQFIPRTSRFVPPQVSKDHLISELYTAQTISIPSN